MIKVKKRPLTARSLQEEELGEQTGKKLKGKRWAEIMETQGLCWKCASLTIRPLAGDGRQPPSFRPIRPRSHQPPDPKGRNSTRQNIQFVLQVIRQKFFHFFSFPGLSLSTTNNSTKGCIYTPYSIVLVRYKCIVLVN